MDSQVLHSFTLGKPDGVICLGGVSTISWPTFPFLMESLEYQAFLETKEFRVLVGGTQEDLPFCLSAFDHISEHPIQVEWMDLKGFRSESLQRGKTL